MVTLFLISIFQRPYKTKKPLRLSEVSIVSLYQFNSSGTFQYPQDDRVEPVRYLKIVALNFCSFIYYYKSSKKFLIKKMIPEFFYKFHAGLATINIPFSILGIGLVE